MFLHSKVSGSKTSWVISRGGRVWTAFPLLKCLRTHYGRHCEPFSGQNALDCKILHIQSQHFWYSGLWQKRCRYLDPDTKFCLARQRSHCSCFMKRPLQHLRLLVAYRLAYWESLSLSLSLSFSLYLSFNKTDNGCCEISHGPFVSALWRRQWNFARLFR